MDTVVVWCYQGDKIQENRKEGLAALLERI